MATVEKKIPPEYFELISSGIKKFEMRAADFEIKEGDTLILKEWDSSTNTYTGREIEKQVGYILKFDLDMFGQRKEIEKDGFYVMQFE